MRIIRPFFIMMVRMRPVLVRQFILASLAEESIEMFCAHTGTGAESLTPSLVFLFSRIELYTFCFSVEIFSNLMRNL